MIVPWISEPIVFGLTSSRHPNPERLVVAGADGPGQSGEPLAAAVAEVSLGFGLGRVAAVRGAFGGAAMGPRSPSGQARRFGWSGSPWRRR